jgi:hypothetical protein
MEFNRQRIVERHTTATEVLEENLPIGPLSHLIFTIDGYNATDEATLAELLGFVNNIQVTLGGVGIVDLQSEDLYGVNAYLLRRLPECTGRLATDNEQRTLTLIVPFGRRIFDPAECFPASPKGKLVLRVDMTVPATSWDNSTISIDAVELVGATPTRYLKTLRKALAAPGATGEREYELPLGNQLVCCQFRMVTVPTTSSHTYGIDIAKLLVNNKEYGYTSADMMCMCGERGLRIGGPSATIAAQGLGPLELMAWMDFDPRNNDDWLIDTADKSSVKLNLNMGVNEAVNLTTLELVKV